MSNIRKSFSFREGVQVDNEVFVVRGNLVGIGTTVPTEKLDIVGNPCNVRIAGLLTAYNAFITGVTTSAKIRSGNNIYISGDSGIITATAFYGNGATLSNLPTSQWVDIDVGLGFTSIYSRGNVGVATNDPRFTFQVGGNPSTQSGVGFNSTGSIRATGIVTAGQFSGSGIGITGINASNISSGTIANSYLPVIDNNRLPSNISVSGIITASSGFSGNLTGNVTGSVTGNVTGAVTGTASLASNLTGSPSITITSATASGNVTAGSLDVGTAGTGIYVSGGRIGIGTSSPNVDVQIRKRSITTLEIISDANEARISIGQSVGIGNSTGLLRYGNTRGTFDVINRGLGSLNSVLHAGTAGVGTGNFNWIYGQTNSELMTLTYDGKLGIGKTNPVNDFEVVGTSTVTGNSFVGGNFSTPGTITFGSGATKATLGSLTGSPILYNTNLNSNAGITTVYNLNVLNKIGIANSSPNAFFDAAGKSALVGNLGISTTGVSTNIELSVYGQSIFTQAVGVGSTQIYNNPLEENGLIQITNGALKFYGAGAVLLPGPGIIGINTSIPRGSIDLSNARNFNNASERTTFIPPVITTAEANAIVAIPDGGIVYNSSRARLIWYNGSQWATAGPVGWVNFDGSGTTGSNAGIRSDYSISTVFKNGTGDYTINFDGPLEDTNGTIQVTAYDDAATIPRMVSDMDLTVNSARIKIRNTANTLVDADTVMVTIFR